MRFDDTLETVLAADVSTGFGKASAWRQLVDLIGRGRIPDDARAIALLESIRGDVPLPVRIASTGALELAEPPAALVKLCVVDEIAVAAPILRTARLSAGEWIELMPRLRAAGRGILRGRRDLPAGVREALDGYRAADFVIGGSDAAVTTTAEPGQAPDRDGAAPPAGASSSFVPVGVAAKGIPLVAAALQQAGDAPAQDGTSDEPAAATPVVPSSVEGQVPVMPGDHPPATPEDGAAGDMPAQDADGPFEIADVVARIDAFYTRQQGQPPAANIAVRADGFRFETDAQGVIRWVDGVSRAPLIGFPLGMSGAGEGTRADATVAGAFRQRSGFSGARLLVAGESDAAGEWRISGNAAFDPATGRFSGYRGVARRPRRDETAVPGASRGADSLRQLMHELRTPTNAIAGFAELIEHEILGDAAAVYRERAAAIRDHARALLAAIDDLDIAARIDASALRLYPGEVALRPLFARIGEELATLAALRGAELALPRDDLSVMGDARAIERLLSRMLATLLCAAGKGERIGVRLDESGDSVAIAFDRPQALAAFSGESLFAIDDERDDVALLGTGFALRLIRNLSRELSGALAIEAQALTIRLPAMVTKSLEQAR